MRSRAMDTFIERNIRTHQRVDSHCPQDVGRVRKYLGLQNGKQSHRQHGLGSVDEGDSFLRFQGKRLDPGLTQGLSRGHPLASQCRFALSDENKPQMRKRRQIATGSDATLRRNNRMYAAIEHLAQSVNYDRSHTGAALGQGIGAQKHHGAGDVFTKRLAYTECMRAHQVNLQLADVFRRNANVAEMADAGCNGIADTIVDYKILDHSTRAIHCEPGVGCEHDDSPVVHNISDVTKSQTISVDMKQFHAGSGLCRSPKPWRAASPILYCSAFSRSLQERNKIFLRQVQALEFRIHSYVHAFAFGEYRAVISAKDLVAEM